MSKKYDLTDVVLKLLGEIHPQGETHGDSLRYQNLEEFCNMMDVFMFELIEIAEQRNSHEGSVSKAGRLADKTLHNITDSIQQMDRGR